MARPESIAIGGFFATPQNVVELIAQRVHPVARPTHSYTPFTLMDPCAGEGAAAFFLRKTLKLSGLCLVELEATRAQQIAKTKSHPDKLAVGDFFHLSYGDTLPQVSVLWLNPPYDTDSDFGRLEDKFLDRSFPFLTEGGLLVFLVPYYALKASARTLAQNFDSIECFRFPEPEWGAFKQVALLARKKAAAEFWDTRLEETILGWAADFSTIPILEPVTEPTIVLPPSKEIYRWEIAPLDLTELATSFDPWMAEKGVVDGFAVSENVETLFRRVYPVASRPRAVHLAAALAAGIFNGVRVTPDKEESLLPPLLVKGVFDKEYRTVEEKLNKKGEKVAEVQVQQPKLSVTVLDLVTGQFHPVSSSSESSAEIKADKLTMRDLLDYYGQALMQGMLQACPVLHDPSNDPEPRPMPEMGRTLYPAQVEAVRTGIKLFETYPNEGVILLGEIGVGKSSVGLAISRAIGRKKPLIVCPPHLLDSWKEQIAAVLPDTPVRVLDTITDVRRFAELSSGIAILSREKAKLGYGWVGMDNSCKCPNCGGDLPLGVDYAKSRTKCENFTIQPKNVWAKWLVKALPAFAHLVPNHTAFQAFQGRFFRKKLAQFMANAPEGVVNVELTEAQKSLFKELRSLIKDGDNYKELRINLAWVYPELACDLALTYQGTSWEVTRENILMAVDPETAEKVRDDFAPYKTQLWSGVFSGTSWYEAYQKHQRGERDRFPRKSHKESIAALSELLSSVLVEARFKRVSCGERLYYSTGPYRYPLASWILHKYPDCFDMLILDEAHEYANKNSAQTGAAQQLLQTRAPKLLLTGSLVNGYAESVYMNMYGIATKFRARFGRDDLSSFIDRYGYWKRVVEDKDSEGKILEYGTQSNRVVRGFRKAGVAPGIMPLFQLEYILPCAITLQKEDLDLGIPPRTDEKAEIVAGGDLYANYKTLLDAVKAEIKRTRLVPEQSGKLWGALARLPSYLDLAVTGNTDDSDHFEIRWPENVPSVGGTLVASVPLLKDSGPLPKELWIIDRVAQEVRAGRNVMVLCWHTRLVGRMASLLKEAGFKTVTLDADKVSTGERQAWIDKHVVKAKVQVMVCNPVVVQTGLNNLVHFSTEVWAENPMCNAIIFRQACGRIDRIGQKEPSTIAVPVYFNTAQNAQYTLLQHKVGVSKSVDGLDPEEALRAAGVVDSEYMGFSVGKQLYKMLTGED